MKNLEKRENNCVYVYEIICVRDATQFFLFRKNRKSYKFFHNINKTEIICSFVIRKGKILFFDLVKGRVLIA